MRQNQPYELTGFHRSRLSHHLLRRMRDRGLIAAADLIAAARDQKEVPGRRRLNNEAGIKPTRFKEPLS
jgi:hypothetical protein